MVPNGWKLTSLGEVCSGNLQTGPFGSQLHAHEYTDEGVPVLMPKDLINYRANNATAAKIPEHRADDLKKHVLKSGDLLFSRRGDVARFALIESDYPRSLCGTGCLKATPNKAHSPLFLSYFLQKNAVKKWLEQNAVGQTMPNMNTAILAELPIMVASSREEEDKIAQILSTWDKAINTTEKLIETSKQQKKALMQQLLTGKRRLVNPETGKAFEGEWYHGFLGDLCTFKGGSAFKESYQGQTQGDFPFIKVSDMNLPRNKKFILQANNWITEDVAKTIKAKTFSKGSVVFAKVGAALLLNRRRILVRPTIIDNNMMAAAPRKICSTEFLYQLMLMVDFAKFVQDGAVPSINQSDLSRFKISYPSIEEQKKIASALIVADKEIEVLEAKLAHFEQEKKALMQQLLTGKRRVKVDEMEAA